MLARGHRRQESITGRGKRAASTTKRLLVCQLFCERLRLLKLSALWEACLSLTFLLIAPDKDVPLPWEMCSGSRKPSKTLENGRSKVYD